MKRSNRRRRTEQRAAHRCSTAHRGCKMSDCATIAVLLFVCACQSTQEMPLSPASTLPDSSAMDASGSSDGPHGGKPIGAPCALQNGYIAQDGSVPREPVCGQQRPLPRDAAADSGNGKIETNCRPPDQLIPPVGVGYCLHISSNIFPDGYFTMNCITDADCPNGSVCNDVSQYCLMPCQSDDQCSAPSKCENPGFKVAVCLCLACQPSPGPQ